MKIVRVILGCLCLCGFTACDDGKGGDAEESGKGNAMSFAEMEAAIAEGEKKQAKALADEAGPVFTKHESLGDRCIEEANASLAKSVAAARAGEEVVNDTSVACDDFWAAVKEDLPEAPEDKLGILWAKWREEHGKPGPSLDG
jgi:hypothetical protein